MISTCPYDCSNKTSDGYCRTTGCINLNYQQNQINQNISVVPENATNGDMIKAMFPNAEITKIMGSFDKDKLLGYRTWLGGRSQDYPLDWWNAPYKKESEG